jgi:hypothetical protein
MSLIPIKSLLSRVLVPLVVLVVAFASVRGQGGDDQSSENSSSGSISGKVLSETGAPIGDAGIFLRAIGGTSPFQFRRVLTNRDGTFRIDGLERALYFVSPSAASYAPYRDFDIPATHYRVGDTITFTLKKGGVITGTVTTATGEPAVGIGVRAVLVREAEGETQRTSGAYFSERTTDDRGVYRIYGLTPGTYVVFAGRSVYSNFPNAFDNQSPSYAPSGPREAAAEIDVRSGEETTGVDIKYRGEPGRSVSGTIVRPPTQLQFNTNTVSLRRVRNGVVELFGYAFANMGSQNFTFAGVPDGEYEIDAQTSVAPSEMAFSEPIKLTVKGADVSGIVLIPRPLGSIKGRVVLEPSTAPECANKRRPDFQEISVVFQKQKEDATAKAVAPLFSGTQATPDKSGEFVARNASGRYSVAAKFFARYWFLRRMAIPAPSTAPKAPGTDLSRTGLAVKLGEQVNNLVVTLTEGAGSIRGSFTLAEGQAPPNGATMFLVPAERDAGDNPLRYYGSRVEADGSFLLSNLAPGSYFSILRTIGPEQKFNLRTLRDSNQNEDRIQLRRDAEAAKSSVEIKPCQNITDFKLPLPRP